MPVLLSLIYRNEVAPPSGAMCPSGERAYAMTAPVLSKSHPLPVRAGVTLVALLAIAALGVFLMALATVTALVVFKTNIIVTAGSPPLLLISTGALAAGFLMLHRQLWARHADARGSARAPA